MRAAACAVAVLALAGCKDAQQRTAEDVLARRVGDADVTCTGAAKVGYLREIETETFLCVARRRSGACDRYRVTLRDGRSVGVRLLRRAGECALPAS